MVHVTKSRAVKCHFPLCYDEELKMEILWERLHQVNASALSVASPRGKELQFGWVGVSLVCTFLCCGLTLTHWALGAGWRVKPAELSHFAVLRGEAQSASQVSQQCLMADFPPGVQPGSCLGLPEVASSRERAQVAWVGFIKLMSFQSHGAECIRVSQAYSVQATFHLRVSEV